MVKSQTIGGFAFKSDQQCLEDVDPGERPFTHKATFVDIAIEMAFSSTFDAFSVALVFRNIRFHPIVP